MSSQFKDPFSVMRKSKSSTDVKYNSNLNKNIGDTLILTSIVLQYIVDRAFYFQSGDDVIRARLSYYQVIRLVVAWQFIFRQHQVARLFKGMFEIFYYVYN